MKGHGGGSGRNEHHPRPQRRLDLAQVRPVSGSTAAICETLESAEADGPDVAAIESERSPPGSAPDIVGHRVVHGGAKVRGHCLIDDTVLADLEAAKTAGPAPRAARPRRGSRWAHGRFPGAPQVACLDTAFHAGMPDVAKTYPLPEDIRAAGVDALRLPRPVVRLDRASARRRTMPDRLVIAHLGGGCSATAVKSGRSDRHHHGPDPERRDDDGHPEPATSTRASSST